MDALFFGLQVADFKLPNLGEGIKDGTVVSVKVKDGDSVKTKDVVLELETAKAVMDIEIPFTGKVTKVAVKAGDKVLVGGLLMQVEETAGSAAPVAQPSAPKAAPAPAPVPAPKAPLAGLTSPTRPTGQTPSTVPHKGLSPEELKALRVVVIGGGPGGYAAAFYAADLGMQVTLVNAEPKLGGTCLIRGCIPSKALLHMAKLLQETKEVAEYGLTFGEPKIDLAKLREWKNKGVVDQLTGGLSSMASMRKVNHIQGKASFLNAKSLKVEKAGGISEQVNFDYAIIATGSIPAAPKAFQIGDERVMDSTGALELKDIPRRLLVIGGGYIGLEMGSVYAALGSKVTVVEFLPSLLVAADRDLVRPLQARLTKLFHAIHLSTKVESLKATLEGIEVQLTGEGVEPKQVFDRVLISVGRTPFSNGLGLENTRIQNDAKGFILHDAQMRTAESNIFVIGDIAGEPMLAHKASAESRVAVDSIAGKRAAWEKACIPAVVFTDPELAWTGITENEAKDKNIPHEVARFPWAASGRALSLARTEGVTKLIFDPQTHRILGMGVVGAGAGELISEGVLAIEMAAVAEDIADSIHPHPTLSETVMEGAEVLMGHSTHLYRPKKH
jgi:dihydrolipoamide dehydrogenase